MYVSIISVRLVDCMNVGLHFVFFLMNRAAPRSTPRGSSAASDVFKGQVRQHHRLQIIFRGRQRLLRQRGGMAWIGRHDRGAQLDALRLAPGDGERGDRVEVEDVGQPGGGEAGLLGLLRRISQCLPDPSRRVTLVIPYGESKVLSEIYEHGRALKREDGDTAMIVEAELPSSAVERFRRYLQKPDAD